MNTRKERDSMGIVEVPSEKLLGSTDPALSAEFPDRHEGHQMLLIVQNRKRVQLVLPDYIVGFGKGHPLLRIDDLLNRSHEVGNRCFRIHVVHAIVAAGDNADQFAVCGAVVSYCDSGVSGPFFQINDIVQGLVGAEV